MKKDIVLQPSIYDDFACIGSDCKNDCCHGWNIDFTKEEFKNVKRKMHTDEFKSVFEDAFYFDKGKCIIKLDENKRCKFLNDDGLCKMYIEVGHENMSVTCKIFPRMLSKYVNSYERFLSIACEKVVDLLLEQEDGLQMEVKEMELPKLEKSKSILFSGLALEKNPRLQLWGDMKILMLGVLQNRAYDFGERMVLLGLAAQKIEKMCDDKQFDAVPAYIQDFIEDIDKNVDSYKQNFARMTRDGKKRASQVSIYHMSRWQGSDIEQKLKERIDYKSGYEFTPETGEDKTKVEMKLNFSTEYNNAKYQQALDDFQEFLKGKEHWLENVMIEGFLAARGFYRVTGGFWRNYCAMAVTYSVFLFVLSCCLEKDSTKEDFKKYVTEIARSMFHNEEHTKALEEHLKETESDTLAHVAILVL